MDGSALPSPTTGPDGTHDAAFERDGTATGVNARIPKLCESVAPDTIVLQPSRKTSPVGLSAVSAHRLHEPFVGHLS